MPVGRPAKISVYVHPVTNVAWYICSSCKAELPETMFHKSKDASNGLNSQCKTCNYSSVKKWRKKNPDWRKA